MAFARKKLEMLSLFSQDYDRIRISFIFRACHGLALVGRLGRCWAGSGRRPIFFSCRGPRPGPAHHFLVCGPRPGPAHQFSRGWAAARLSPSNFRTMGRSLARPVKSRVDGPRPVPHHKNSSHGPWPCSTRKISNWWAAARPGPSHFEICRPAPARPIKVSSSRAGPARSNTFSTLWARPGRTHHIFKIIGRAWPGP